MKLPCIIHSVARFRHTLLHYLCYLIAVALCAFRKIDQSRYFCICMNGNGYGCNVKAFADYVKKNEATADVVWAFSPSFFKVVTSEKKVRLYTVAYYINLLSSKVIVSNQRFTKELMPKKRKGQVYIQFWHGTALKRIEADIPCVLESYKKRAIWDSSLIDVVFSGSAFMTNLYKTAFWYDGIVVETGTPRNDIFFQSDCAVKQKVTKLLNIPKGHNIILYAPTFRNDLSLTNYNLNSGLLLSLLKEKFGGRWTFVVRIHPNLLNKRGCLTQLKELFPNAVDGSVYSDMQELLAASDCLITDYSSSMFDFAHSKKPCFLFTPDKGTYERGYYDFIMNRLPFDSFVDDEGMMAVIKKYDKCVYGEKVRSFLTDIGSVECGRAAEKAFDYLKKRWGGV